MSCIDNGCEFLILNSGKILNVVQRKLLMTLPVELKSTVLFTNSNTVGVRYYLTLQA